MSDMLRAAEKQARILSFYLDVPVPEVPARLTELVPSIHVRNVPDLPMPGTSFWARSKGWHIYVRATDSPEAQVFTLLHQLKQIVDHPLRKQAAEFSNADWETIAYYFASHVVMSTRCNPATPHAKGECL